ncbi:hypothetical protein C4K03_3880 [Pseudomonas synxantha]|uniref:Uncharacterized protein n=1 Tax=Pseudomonas synxantha TaxID=47883 RepID=A0A3G7UBL5_9PSED|nr:hypothetical protein [Pseudomonas synxantha]AZE56032.1 hypothetical protein C4K03_3880 [Pseudomonas synxantha]
MLAKNVNDNAGILVYRGVIEFFASKLAPTRGWPFFSAKRQAKKSPLGRRA